MRKRGTHTHTHTHTPTHTHTRTHTHTQTHTYTHTACIGLVCLSVCVCACMFCCVCRSLGLLSRTSYISVFLCVLCAWSWLSSVCYVHDDGYHCNQTFSIYLGVCGGAQLHVERVRGAAARWFCKFLLTNSWRLKVQDRCMVLDRRAYTCVA